MAFVAQVTSTDHQDLQQMTERKTSSITSHNHQMRQKSELSKQQNNPKAISNRLELSGKPCKRSKRRGQSYLRMISELVKRERCQEAYADAETTPRTSMP